MARVIVLYLLLTLVTVDCGDQYYNFIVHQAPCAINQTNPAGKPDAAVVVPIAPGRERPTVSVVAPTPPGRERPSVPGDALGKKNEANIDDLRSQLARMSRDVASLKLRLSQGGGGVGVSVSGIQLAGTYVYFGNYGYILVSCCVYYLVRVRGR